MRAEQWVPSGHWRHRAGFGDELDWSGETCIYVCGTCGHQGGLSYALDDTKQELSRHRNSAHPGATGNGEPPVRTCRICNKTTRFTLSHGMCTGCIHRARKQAVKELEDA